MFLQGGMYTYEIVKEMIYNMINFDNKNVFYKCYNFKCIKYEIVDYDKMLIICNIIYTLGKYITKFNMKKKLIY